MLIAMVLVVYAVAIIHEFIPSMKEIKLKEKVVYFSLLSVSFCVLLLYSLGIMVPGPSEAIRNIVGFFVRL